MRLAKLLSRRGSDVGALRARARGNLQSAVPAGMDGFLAEFKEKPAAKGISRKGISALDGIAVDPAVLAGPRPPACSSNFEISGRIIWRDRMTKGLRHMHTHAATLKRVEQSFGVPGAVWWLRCAGARNRLRHRPRARREVIRSVATLAFDCRRTEMFQNQLMDALRIVDHGDLARPKCAVTGRASSDRHNSWPRPISSMPSTSTATAGAICSIAAVDVLASTANYLKGYGWKRRQALERRRSQLRSDPRLEQGPWSTPRPSRPSPSAWKAAAPAPKSRAAKRHVKSEIRSPGQKPGDLFSGMLLSGLRRRRAGKRLARRL